MRGIVQGPALGGVAELLRLWRASLRAKSNRGGAGPPLLLALPGPEYALNASDFTPTLVEADATLLLAACVAS